MGTRHLGDLHPLSKPCKKVVGWDVPTASSRQEVQESCPVTAEKKQERSREMGVICAVLVDATDEVDMGHTGDEG